jgi:hypothetical protein
MVGVFNGEYHCWTYICKGCDYEINVFGGEPREELCGVCQFIQNNPRLTEEDKAKIYEWTNIRGDNTRTIRGTNE